jgi:hypothetical protein
MKAQIGLMVEGQMGLNWARWTRVRDTAERCGYQCVFRSDHTSLTYAATRTHRIEFGSLGAPVTFRHPAMTIRQAAAIDELSGGNEGIERPEAYLEAGCQRFMLQLTDYDNLAPIEAWAAAHLAEFHR